MSKNGRDRLKGKGSGGSGGPGARIAPPRSLSAFRAGRALDALTPAFVRWSEAGSPGSAAAALECLTPIKAVLGHYMERTAAADVTCLEPAALAAAISDEILAAVVPATAGAVGDIAGTAADREGVLEDTSFVIGAVHAFVDFLVETDRWSGSTDQLAEVMDFFDSIDGDDGGWGYIEVPEVPDEDAVEVFSGLPLIRQASALLEWIGAGKPVTATGALRLRDIEAAAACVGVTVRGGPRRSGAPLPGQADSVGHMPTVRSMYEVPQLAQLWNTLEATELIEIKSTKVIPAADTGAFLTGGAPTRLEELEYFVDQYLETAVLEWDPAQPWERTVSGLQASILLAAATAEPPEKARVLTAPDHAPAAEKAMAAILTGMAVSRLEDLAGLGLLTIDTHFRVPPALIRCVARVFDDEWVLADLGLGPASDDIGLESAGRIPAANKAAVPEKALKKAPEKSVPMAKPGLPADTSVLQLKVMLNDSKPPIWRRVLVPAGMPLPQLHQVIQALFGWLDYHLHEFRTGGFRGPVYAPQALDGDDDFPGDASRDEADVTVGELLPAVGSSMAYTYDFGDNWVHAIKLEKILASDDGGQLPRCTAGRGAAPAEDSGGTWGWANIVDAVNDPGHEEHKEYREWLGMLPGETLDPKAFDVEEVNGDLADLF